LLIKHGRTDRADFIANFLEEHQSMGIYLYGELAISGRKGWRRLAETVFRRLAPEMDRSAVTNVKELLGWP
jgi:hypothetical protein